MSNHRKNGGPRKSIVPPLSRARLRLEEAKRRGGTSQYYEQDVERLSQDPAQVALGLDFALKLERLLLEMESKQRRAEEALKALARTDLTHRDAMEIIKALKECEELGLTLARLKIDYEEDLRWHPWKKYTI